MPCPWGMAALPKSPSRPHSQPWPQCPLVPPHSLGLELAGRPCSLWEWLCCDTLPPSWPLLVHKPELWQGQTCGPGCPLSSLLQGLTPHSQLGMWPPKGRLRRPGAPQLPGRTMAHPCPGPSPRDNNGRSRSRSRLSSSPPESLEGAGAGGGPWAERQRLPPSPALCLARVASLPPSHLQPPQGREGHSSSILGIQRAPLGSCRAPALLPHGSGLPAADRPPDPPSSCFVSRCARALSARERPGEAARRHEHLPSTLAVCTGRPLAREGAASAPWHSGHRAPELVPTSPFLPCSKDAVGLGLCPCWEVRGWAEGIPEGGMVQPCY